MLIWEVETKKVIATHVHPKGRITSLHFSPISNLLAFTDSTGEFTRWTNPIPATHPHPAERFPTTAPAPVINQRRARSPLFGDDELVVPPAKRPAARRKAGDGTDDEMEGDDLERDEARSVEEEGEEYGDDWALDEDETEGAFRGLDRKKESAVERWGGGGGGKSGGREVGE